VRVRYALANSLNVPAVRVLEKITVPVFLEHLHRLGFTHLTHSPEHYGLGLTLGSGEVNLWELARAYLTIAKQGERVELNLLKFPIPNSRFPIPDSPIPSPSTWSLIIDMLGDRHARARAFGVDSLLSLPFPAAVKTGTSSDFRDTWTVGFTTEYTVAVWVGNFDGAPMQKVSGVMGAAPLWNRIMLHLHEQREPAPFPPPRNLVQRPICALSGARPTPACPAVVEEYLFPEDLQAYDRQPDPFYKSVPGGNGQRRYQLTLPPEYNEWLAMQSQPVTQAIANSSDLRILSPHNGDYFLMEPGESASQRLQFKLATIPASPVEWRLNGKLLATQTGNSLFWNLQPGSWTLEAKSGEQSDRVNFEVQLAQSRPTRRGFSFGS
jgi:penicillin-binding protein 1C